MTFTGKRGFTLVELLVVISIISLLSSVVLSSLNAARSKARDARRLQDFHQIQNALATYLDENGTYPPYANRWSSRGNWLTFIPSNYISSIPVDPQNIDLGACDTQIDCHVYHYCAYNSNMNFSLSVNLENPPKGTYVQDVNCPTGGTNLYVLSQ